ncbi:MAG: bifunctional phosphopantothenoylcysteine decarboxylase/phosphopantothenate--cysteine ligase CoaBC [Deltaproteobacteria bacterium]|jgi:phosphopantothenoylcysteine decarboxylase/phosphopantothenate--cysteine ligase|nr:bifunctional phosphopantothenoylcysteine decarboxylase/phosphopantothenate--cysteine ligase CoaBC [Deltaproteobacteria bacterium]
MVLAEQAAIYNEPLQLLRGRRILLTVCGGVAAYKAAALASLLTRQGALVRTALTAAAQRFVAPLTFSALTGQPTVSEMWERPDKLEPTAHVAWADWAEALVTAPASADFVAKLAHGLADDWPSTAALAFSGPRLTAPAMNASMYLNPATADNLALLARRGHRVLSAPEGRLACGASGPGRLAEPEIIALETARLLSAGPLRGQKVVVAGGATREPWDDIRFLSNRSSGRFGSALALAAWLLGAETVLLAGPGAAEPPGPLEGLTVARFETCQDLLDQVLARLDGAWALVMNAAPADFRPAQRVQGKIKKSEKTPSLPLIRTPDILKSVRARKGSTLMVGFAAEDATEEGERARRARRKLEDKGLDYVAANQAGGPDSAFGAETVAVRLLAAEGWEKAVGPCSKFAAAWSLWGTIAATEAAKAGRGAAAEGVVDAKKPSAGQAEGAQAARRAKGSGRATGGRTGRGR